MNTHLLHTVYLSGGSNLGNRLEYLQKAQKAIENRVGAVFKKSPVYITSSWANAHEPSYLNIIWVVHTALIPEQVLAEILDIEKSLGRVRTHQWAPRTIDIDILFYDDDIIQNAQQLIVPHLRLEERKFWLVPLQILCPHKIHPVLQKNITQLLSECIDTGSVVLYKN